MGYNNYNDQMIEMKSTTMTWQFGGEHTVNVPFVFKTIILTCDHSVTLMCC